MIQKKSFFSKLLHCCLLHFGLERQYKCETILYHNLTPLSTEKENSEELIINPDKIRN